VVVCGGVEGGGGAGAWVDGDMAVCVIGDVEICVGTGVGARVCRDVGVCVGGSGGRVFPRRVPWKAVWVRGSGRGLKVSWVG